MSSTGKIAAVADSVVNTATDAAKSAKNSVTDGLTETQKAATRTFLGKTNSRYTATLIDYLKEFMIRQQAQESEDEKASIAKSKAVATEASKVAAASKAVADKTPLVGSPLRSRSQDDQSKTDKSAGGSAVQAPSSFIGRWCKPLRETATSIGSSIYHHRGKAATAIALAGLGTAYYTGQFDDASLDKISAWWSGAQAGNSLRGTADDLTKNMSSALGSAKDTVDGGKGFWSSFNNTKPYVAVGKS